MRRHWQATNRRIATEVDLNDDAALDELIRNRADTVYHPVGTCRMGSDADAVVDTKLKARGVEGLWIADATIMPRLVSGNTNAPEHHDRRTLCGLCEGSFGVNFC